MHKIKTFFKGLLYSLLSAINRTDIEKEHQERISSVRAYFHEVLPVINSEMAGKVIIENGTFNYFELPDGKLPTYDFVLPELPLYVIVPGILSSDWEQAHKFGVPRNSWEEFQETIAYIEASTKALPTIGNNLYPKVLVIRWNETTNHFAITQRLKTMNLGF